MSSLAFNSWSAMFYWQLSQTSPAVVTARAGEAVRLLCRTDSHYEYCKFYSPSGSFCDFEWKRLAGNITRQVKHRTANAKPNDKISFSTTFKSNLFLFLNFTKRAFNCIGKQKLERSHPCSFVSVQPHSIVCSKDLCILSQFSL